MVRSSVDPDPPTFGELVVAARTAAKKTQTDVVDALGSCKVTYWSDVERDRRALPRERWKRLVKVLPSLTLDALAEAEVATRHVRVDARDLDPASRAVLAKLVAACAAKEGR